VEMIEKEQEMAVTLGGKTFKHAGRKSYLLCQFCCGGFTGLHKSKKWSTWSPGRFTVPESEEEIKKELLRAVSLYNQRPAMPGGYIHSMGGLRQNMTCGNCQIICWGDKKETAQNLKLLHSSGCVFQRPDGSLYAVAKEEAESVFQGMDSKHKQLYY
jgi:epoxyqueuosine reductase